MKRKFQKILSLCLTLMMVAGFIPVGIVNVEAATNDGLVLNKSIELQPEGNYKITLEAYSTGQDVTSTVTEAVPLDIVLVLDQSGSMDYTMTSSTGTYSVYYESGKAGYRNIYSRINEGTELYVLVNDQYYKLSATRSGNSGNRKYTISYTDGNGTTQYIANNASNATVNSAIYQYSATIKRLEALKNAVSSFITTVQNKAAADNVDHRIAIVGFASADAYGYNTEILSVSGNNSGTVGVRYASNSVNSNSLSAYNTAKANAFQDTTTESGKTMLTNAVNALAANGATNTGLGMQMAKDILESDSKKSDTGRKRLVIMFTDGTPTTSSTFSSTVANTAISNAKDIKNGTLNTDGTVAVPTATVYTIGIFDGADPSSLTSDENKFMNYVSSNYKNATSMDVPGNRVDNGNYYMAASNTSELNDIFETISNSEVNSGSSVTLTSSAVLRDIISTNFTIAEGTQADVIKLYTADSNVVTANADGTTASVTWKDRVSATDLTATVTGNQIDITGFDYSTNYVTATHAGKKLIVEVFVNAITSGENLKSNDTLTLTSGIYESSEADTYVKKFESPVVTIPEYNYVLDFGKQVAYPNDDFDVTATTIIHGSKAAPNKATPVVKKYGAYSLENNVLNYQPQSINWDGIDSVFAFGREDTTVDGSTTSTYKWFKVSTIPATSVYYEDDFNATVENTPANSKARIVYSGTYETVTDGTTQNDGVQSSENRVYGTDSSYNNDSKYSDGSATQMTSTADTGIATATFTFTGTGVDIYSRTDNDTGIVRATVYNEEGDIVKQQRVDTLYDNGSSTNDATDGITSGADGELYQIPTISLNLGSKATYTVKIQVAFATSYVSKYTYYLDGIRIYNPLGEVPSGIAGDAYKEADEFGAAVIRLRDIMLGLDETKVIADNSNVTTDTPGIAFIDSVQGKQKNETITLDTSNLQTYKEYGPKNEIYLAKNNTITFKVNTSTYGTSDSKVFIGMKSPTGNTAKVTYTKGSGTTTASISSATDMYYEVTPTEAGYVTITNSGDALLSITKLKMTQVTVDNSDGKAGLISVSTDVLNYTASAFSDLPITTEEDVETQTVDVEIENYNSGPEVTTSTTVYVWNDVSESVAVYMESSN